MIDKFAVQLYTVRNELQQDLPGVFRKIKEMGWKGVQISALPEGYNPNEIVDLLNETGLKAAGMHVSIERMKNELENVLLEASLYKTKDIVCPYLEEDIRTVEGYQYVKGLLNNVARASEGYRISYHNHAFEFDTNINGLSALEYLLERSEQNHILAEIDVYWIKKGGLDPLRFIEPYANRMPIIHLKDMTNDEHQTFAELGTGVIDFEPIINWGEKSGIEWYVVEQDECPGDPMESLQTSFNYIQRLLKV